MPIIRRDPHAGDTERLGRIALVLLDRLTHHATHIVARRGLITKHDIIVPLDWAIEITPERIVIDAEDWPLEQLPEERPDAVIAEDIRQALYADPAFGAGVDFYSIRVSVHDGIATLAGNVRTSTRRREAEQLARRVRGVLDVNNQLIADDEIELYVEQAIALDDRLRIRRLAVESVLGVVRLQGEVETAEQRNLALEVARHVPGVLAVQDALEVRPAPERTP